MAVPRQWPPTNSRCLSSLREPENCERWSTTTTSTLNTKYEESELSDHVEEADSMVASFNSEASILYLYMNRITRDDIKNHENSAMYFAHKWIVNFAQGRYDQLLEELCKYTTKKIVKGHELPIDYS